MRAASVAGRDMTFSEKVLLFLFIVGVCGAMGCGGVWAFFAATSPGEMVRESYTHSPIGLYLACSLEFRLALLSAPSLESLRSTR